MMSLSIISTLIFSFSFILNAEASIYNYKSKFQNNDPNYGIISVKCKQNNWVKKKACQAKEAAEKKARQAREKAAAAARAAEAARQRAQAEARRRAEEAARRAAAEAKKRAEEAARRAAAEAKKRAEEAARRAAAAAKKKAEQAAAASKKAAENAKKQAAKAAKAAGAGLSAAYLASYKHVTPYANSTAELAKDIGNDAAKFVKNQFDTWGCYATVGSVTQHNTATALLRKLIPIMKKEMKNNLKMASYDYNNYNNQNVSFVSNSIEPENFLQNDTFLNKRGIINASLLNPLSSIKTPKFIDDENGLIEIKKKKKKRKKCGKRCKRNKRKAKERAKKQNLKKKAEQKRLAKENKIREKAVAKRKKLNKGAVAAGTGTAVIVGSAAAAAGYGKSYKPVKIDTSSPEKMAASTFAVIKRNTTGYGQLLKGGGNLALNATRIYSEVLNAEFLCNKTKKQQIKILKSYKIFPKKGIKFASANMANNNFAFLDNIKDIKLRNLLISKAYAADGGKANDPAEPFFGLELGAGVSGDMGFGSGAGIAFTIITDMDDEVYSFFTVSISQLFDFANYVDQTPAACVGATLRVFGTPPTKVNNFKGLGHSVGFSVGPQGNSGFARAGAAIGLDVGISSKKSGSQFTGLAIGPEVSLCSGSPTNQLPIAAALNASTSWSYRLW